MRRVVEWKICFHQTLMVNKPLGVRVNCWQTIWAADLLSLIRALGNLGETELHWGRDTARQQWKTVQWFEGLNRHFIFLLLLFLFYLTTWNESCPGHSNFSLLVVISWYRDPRTLTSCQNNAKDGDSDVSTDLNGPQVSVAEIIWLLAKLNSRQTVRDCHWPRQLDSPWEEIIHGVRINSSNS